MISDGSFAVDLVGLRRAVDLLVAVNWVLIGVGPDADRKLLI